LRLNLPDEYVVAPLAEVDPEINRVLRRELERQRNTLEMIASENFVPQAVLEAVGSVLTNKYAEGYPGKRYYGGCEEVDGAEQLATDRTKKLFGAEHVNALDGQTAEDRLEEVGITVYRNAIPFDERPPMNRSGLRIGTPALTTRSMVEEDMREIGRIIAAAFGDDFEFDRESLLERGRALMERYPQPSAL